MSGLLVAVLLTAYVLGIAVFLVCTLVMPVLLAVGTGILSALTVYGLYQLRHLLRSVLGE
jgi:hypothetical protein